MYALQHNIQRIPEDHARARKLASALAALPGLTVFEDRLDINMVWFTLESDRPDDEIVEEMYSRGVWILPSLGGGQWRTVTHLDIDDEALDHAIAQFQAVLG